MSRFRAFDGLRAPPLPLAINWGCAQSNGLIFSYPGFDPRSRVNLASNKFRATGFGSTNSAVTNWPLGPFGRRGFYQNFDATARIEFPPINRLWGGRLRFMVMMWIKQVAITDAWHQALVSSWNGSDTANLGLLMRRDSGGGGTWSSFYSNGTTFTSVGSSGMAVAVGETAHIAFTNDGSVIRAWKNGVRGGTTAASIGATGTADTPIFRIGGIQLASGDAATQAIIQDLRIYEIYDEAIVRAAFRPQTRWDLFDCPTVAGKSGAATTNVEVAASGAGAVNISRSVGKLILPAGVGAVSLLRATSKTVGAAGSGSVSVLTPRTVPQIVAAAASGAVAITRQAGKIVTAAGAGAVSMLKSIAKTVAASGTGTVTAAAIRVFLVSVSAAGAGAVTVVRGVGKMIGASGLGNVSILKGAARTVSAASAGAVSVLRGIGKTVAAAGASSVAVTTIRAVLVVVSATGAGAVTVARVTGKTVAAAGAGAVSITRGIAKTLALAGSGIVTIIATGGAVAVKAFARALNALRFVGRSSNVKVTRAESDDL